MKGSFVKYSILAMFLLIGCRENRGDSSASVQQSRKDGLLVAEYIVPFGADLGEYRPIEVWVETPPGSSEQQIIVRLAGPHHGREPRVQIAGLDDMQYRGIWSERSGPPYERWIAPRPLPDMITLERDGRKIQIQRKAK